QPEEQGQEKLSADAHLHRRTREYLWGELRNGDRPTGKQIHDHLKNAMAALPAGIREISARAVSGCYCAEAVEAYEEGHRGFVIVARKTSRLVEELEHAEWKPSPKTDAAEQCEFVYQPDGWKKAYRFVALRYARDEEHEPADEVQYQLFETRP